METKYHFFSGLFLSAFCTELWQYYAAIGLTFMELAKYGVIRSLLSKCVDKDETGKILSAASILAAIVPFGANPAIRQIYMTKFPKGPFLYYVRT